MEKLCENSQEVWGRCLEYIKLKINLQSYKTWFEPIIPKKIENNTLTIQVPNQFFYEWLEEHYIDILKEVIIRELGRDGKLAYSIKLNKINEDILKKIEPPKHLPNKEFLNFHTSLDGRYTFENFVEGDSNRLTKSAAQAIAKKPGDTAFNPLLIYGGVGLGKTHIMHAISYEVRRNFPNKICFYLSSKKFVDHFIESIKNNKVQDFLDYFLQAEVLLIDDIQFLSSKDKTQEMFFHIFNHMHQYNRQIVITSDCPPVELKGLQERLLSRFKWGLTTDIQKPDFETRLAIIQNKLDFNSIDLTEDLINYLALHIDTNVRDLEGIIVSILAHSTIKEAKIDLNLIKQIISNIIKVADSELDVEYLKQLVSEKMKVPMDEIEGSTRKKEFVIARQTIMYLAKKYTNLSLKSIGESFKKIKHHSTVIHAQQAVENMIVTEKFFKKKLIELENTLKLKVPQI